MTEREQVVQQALKLVKEISKANISDDVYLSFINSHTPENLKIWVETTRSLKVQEWANATEPKKKRGRKPKPIKKKKFVIFFTFHVKSSLLCRG